MQPRSQADGSELPRYSPRANKPSQELSVEPHRVETTGRNQLWLAEAVAELLLAGCRLSAKPSGAAAPGSPATARGSPAAA